MKTAIKYLKCLFFNFLVVFFANHVLPGIEVIDLTKLPHLGGDFLFALGLGFLNSLIYPILKKFLHPVTIARLAVACFALNLIAYAIMKLIPIGIQVMTVEGYLLASCVVSIGSLLLNYSEMKSNAHIHHKVDEPVIHHVHHEHKTHE